MKKSSALLILTSFVAINLLDFTKSVPHHANNGRPKLPGADLNLSQENFQSFSSFFQRQVSFPSYISAVLGQGQSRANGVLLDPASLGSMYSVLRGNIFDVETHDIDAVLDKQPNKDPLDIYATIQGYLNKVPDTFATSALFSPTGNLPLSPGLQKLNIVQVTVGQFENSTAAASSINSYVSDHTEHLLTNQLISELDVPFYNSTEGVLVNTLYGKYNFATPFSRGPNMEFRVSPEEALSVESIEVSSVFKFHEGGETVVVIPMQNSNKRLILIKPDDFEDFTRNKLGAFADYMNTISTHPLLKIQYFSDYNVRVQVPIFNLTVARSFLHEYEVYDEALSKTSIERSQSAICDSATDRKYLLQRPVQVSTTRLSAESVEFAAALGVQIDNVQEYRRLLGASPGNSNNNSDQSSSNLPDISLVSITETPGGRLELDVSDGVAIAEPEAEAEPEPLADESVTAASNSVISSPIPVTNSSETKVQADEPYAEPEPVADNAELVRSKLRSDLNEPSSSTVAPQSKPEIEMAVEETTVAERKKLQVNKKTTIGTIKNSKPLAQQSQVSQVQSDAIAEPEPEAEAEPERANDDIVETGLKSKLKSVSVSRSNMEEMMDVQGPVADEPMIFSKRSLKEKEMEKVEEDNQMKLNKGNLNFAPVVMKAEQDTLARSDVDGKQVSVVFDTPFYMGIFDEGVGIYSFLAIRAPYASPISALPIESNDLFSDYEKLKRWACLSPPPPFSSLPSKNKKF